MPVTNNVRVTKYAVKPVGIMDDAREFTGKARAMKYAESLEVPCVVTERLYHHENGYIEDEIVIAEMN